MRRYFDNLVKVMRVMVLIATLLFLFAGRPPVMAQQDYQSERFNRMDDHIKGTDGRVQETRDNVKDLQQELRTLEQQVNEWKGAEDVWLKVIAALAGGGIIFQVPGKLRRQKENEK